SFAIVPLPPASLLLQSNQMNVVRIELRQNCIAQRDHVRRIDGNRHVSPHLGRMTEHICNVRECSVAELKHVTRGMEVGDGVLAEISSKNECVVAAIAE